jgi:hypothetical protein
MFEAFLALLLDLGILLLLLKLLTRLLLDLRILLFETLDAFLRLLCDTFRALLYETFFDYGLFKLKVDLTLEDLLEIPVFSIFLDG